MCGRYILKSPSKVVKKLLEIDDAPDIEAHYNIAPTQQVWAALVSRSRPGRQLRALRWGLVPSWADGLKGSARMINARVETVATMAAFKFPFRRRRCLVPADGFYEWVTEEGQRQPYLIHRQDRQPFAMAGLWDVWKPADGATPVISCTILTMAANDLVRPLHNRMPIIMKPERFSAWLDRDLDDASKIKQLLEPVSADEMAFFPVSSRVNDVKNDDAACAQPLEDASA